MIFQGSFTSAFDIVIIICVELKELIWNEIWDYNFSWPFRYDSQSCSWGLWWRSIVYRLSVSMEATAMSDDTDTKINWCWVLSGKWVKDVQWIIIYYGFHFP